MVSAKLSLRLLDFHSHISDQTTGWAGRGLLAAILAIELVQVGVAVLLNAWNARFYDALQHKNAAAFGYELLIFAPLVAAFILLAVYQLYLSQALQFGGDSG